MPSIYFIIELPVDHKDWLTELQTRIINIALPTTLLKIPGRELYEYDSLKVKALKIVGA